MGFCWWCWRLCVDLSLSPLSLQIWDFFCIKLHCFSLWLQLKWVGDLHALSVHPSCTQFSLEGFKFIMFPNAAYLPEMSPSAVCLGGAVEVAFFVPCVYLLHLLGSHQDVYLCEPLLSGLLIHPGAEYFPLDCGGLTRSIAAAWAWLIC